MPRVMEITTPLGPEVLLFHTMHAREELSRVCECRLELLSLKNDINLDQILGKNVTVKLALQDDKTRYFNGFVSRFSQGGSHGRYRRYYAVVHPWLWFLSRTADCRIFQDKTVPEIVKIIFGEHPTSSFKDDTTGSYAKWTYCVQYRETDLNFVCRMLETEGIYFYFTHADGKHTLVMADSYSGHAPFQGKPVPFIDPDAVARPDIEHVSAWSLTREIQPGVYVHDDYDLERPSVELRAQKAVSRGYSPSTYEVYDYPGEYLQKSDGEASAAVRIDEFAAQFETAQGETNVKNISVGSLFNLERCPRADQNREHLVVAATYDMEYSDYEAMPERGGAEYPVQFRRHVEQAAVPAEAPDAEAVRAGTADRGRGRAGRRGDLHRQVRPREGAVPLGPRGREEGREQLLLGPGVTAVGGQALGRVDHPAHRPGGHRRLPRGRPRSADHHRQRLQRRADAAVRAAGEQDPERHQEPQHPGRLAGQLQRDPLRGPEGVGAAVHPRGEEPGHRGRERRDPLGRARPEEDDRPRQDSERPVKTTSRAGGHNKTIDDRRQSHGDDQQGDDASRSAQTLTETVAINYAETVGGAMELTVGGALAITVGAAMAETVGGAKTETIGGGKSETIGGNLSVIVGKNARRIDRRRTTTSRSART